MRLMEWGVMVVWAKCIIFAIVFVKIMLFNSFEFLVFLPIVFLLYWFVFNRSLKWQNVCEM